MGQIGEWIANLPPWAIVSVVVVLGLFWLRLRKMDDNQMLLSFGPAPAAPKPKPKPQPEEKKKSKSDAQQVPMFSVRWTREAVESMIIAIVLVFGLVRPFVAQSFYIPSGSMLPTLHIGDRLLVNKFIYRFHDPRRGDIMVFRAPGKASMDNVERDLIKRVVGVPGDVIEFRDNHLYVNGQLQHEKYISGTDRPFSMTQDTGDPLSDRYYLAEGFHWENGLQGLQRISDAEAKVKPGYLFMMGDNRNNSNDSRFWGALQKKRVVGKAWIMFWPIPRVRLIR